jgi:hypothetical protein
MDIIAACSPIDGSAFVRPVFITAQQVKRLVGLGVDEDDNGCLSAIP